MIHAWRFIESVWMILLEYKKFVLQADGDKNQLEIRTAAVLPYHWLCCSSKHNILASFKGHYIFIFAWCSSFMWEQLKLSQPNPDDLGYVDSISVEEIGGIRVQI